MWISEATNGYHDCVRGCRGIPEDGASALGAKVLFDSPGFECLPLVYLITAIDGDDIALFEEA